MVGLVVRIVPGGNGADYPCTVGKLEYTSPELQGRNFRSVGMRTANHDAFGLAVMMFQLLMGGQHPFSGVWQGGGEDPPLKTRIREFRYA